jgi:hypothetical protein
VLSIGDKPKQTNKKHTMKKLTQTEKIHLLFDECFNLEQEFRKTGNGWFHYTRGGGIESAIDILGFKAEYDAYRTNKIAHLALLQTQED